MLKLFEPLFRFEATVDEDRDDGRKYFTVTRLKHTDNSKTELTLEVDTSKRRLKLKRRRQGVGGGRGSDLNTLIRVVKSSVDCVRLLLIFPADVSWDFLLESREQLDRCVRLLKDHCSSDTEFSTSTMFRAVEWVNDQAVTHCFRCDTQFSMTFRRHHCRNCGQVVCAQCSEGEATIPRFGIQVPVRVCTQCYGEILNCRVAPTKGLISADTRSKSAEDLQAFQKNFFRNRSFSSPEESVGRRQARKRRWEEFMATHDVIEPQDPKIRNLCRGGIPPEHRGPLWAHLSGARRKKAKQEETKPNYYQSLLDYANVNPPNHALSTLEKDLPRTSPIHSIYHDQEATAMLRRILTAYAIRNQKVGYCQSMNFIGALLLLFTEEEEAFWLLCTLVEDLTCVNGHFYHQADLAGVHIDECVFSDLVQNYLPHVYDNIEKLMVPLLPLTVNWFLCLYVNSLPLEIELRVWDILFCEGSDIIFHTGLALLKIHEHRLANADNFEHVLNILKDTQKITMSADDFILNFCFNPAFEKISEQIPQRRAFHETHVQQLINEQAAKEENVSAKHNRRHSTETNLLFYKDSIELGKESAKVDFNQRVNVNSVQQLTGKSDLDTRMVHLDPNFSQRYKQFAQYFGNIEINQDVITEYFEQPDEHPDPDALLRSSSFFQFSFDEEVFLFKVGKIYMKTF